jgi:hypothetical protein
VVLAAVLLIGGGRRLLQAWRARGAVGRLHGPDVTPETIAAAAEHGRAGLMDLFRLLGSAETEPLRQAAGRAIAVLWARDELVAEEEKALVRRGYQVAWRGRKRYPRGLKAEIPISVRYGVPFLDEDGLGVRPSNLEWSHLVTGARRASLEAFGPWTAGPGCAEFAIVPDDFETNGPHRLVLKARVRTAGLSDAWEMELPHMPFGFEFDPLLKADALFALPDEARAGEFGRRVRLSAAADRTDDSPAFLPLNESFAVRNPPVMEVATPLPCDLAHVVEVSFEGVPGWFRAGAVVVLGAGFGETTPGSARRIPIDTIDPLPAAAIERPGARRMRVRLTPDADLGWAQPDVRSVWPGVIEPDWAEADIVRR